MSRSGKRHRAREMAMQMLYQAEMGRSPLAQIFQEFDLSEYVAEEVRGAPGEGKIPPAEHARARDLVDVAFGYARRLVEGTREKQEDIDALIEEQAENWRLERMPPVDRNILRLAVYELLHEPDVPRLVIVDEAIELAKRFGSENSGRFVNGLLDGLLRSARLPRRAGE
jgi:N utilization substance protein B